MRILRRWPRTSMVLALIGIAAIATAFIVRNRPDDLGPWSKPSVIMQRGDEAVKWKLLTYALGDESCLDVVGYVQSQPIGGPGACGGFHSVTEQLLAQLPTSTTLPSWAVRSPPGVRDLVRGAVVADGTSPPKAYSVVGGLLTCDCTAHVVWQDGTTTDAASSGGFFIAWHVTTSALTDDDPVITALAG